MTVAAEAFAFPATRAQERLLFLAASDPTAAAYNIAKALWIDGPLDISALRGALQIVVARHEALQTTIAHVGGRAMQLVSATRSPDLAVIDVQPAADEPLASAIERIASDEARRPFDLVGGVLARARLFRLGPDQHLFCFTVHHIICDAWSMGVLSRELAQAYGALSGGVEPRLGPPPLQYVDYAAWEQQQDRDSGPSLEYWRRELANVPCGLDWPADYRRPPTWGGAGDTIAIPLPPAAYPALRELAAAERTTTSVVVLAAFAEFIRRWTGCRDVPIGTPVAGRDRVELEGVVGLFVNTVVTRFQLDGVGTFRELVRAGRRVMVGALEHQATPLESVVKAVRADHGRGGDPLFHAMFTLHEVAGDMETLGTLPWRTVPAATRTAKCDLTLVGVEAPGTLRLAFEYSTELFARPTLETATEMFGTLLTAAAAEPDRPLDDLGSPQGAAASVLDGPSRAFPRDNGIHQVFAAVAATYPDAVAVEDATRPTTYAELKRHADGIAAALQAVGVRPGQRVALVAGGGGAMVAATIGIVAAGAVYVPVDPTLPEARVLSMLDDAGVSAIVTAGSAPWCLPGALPVVDAGAARRSGTHPAPVELPGDAPAYIMYTSGSTGNPKGVVVPHRAIARLVLNTDYVAISRDDRVAHAANPAFDAATFEIWGALLNGATVVMLSRDAVSSPLTLSRDIVGRRLSILFITTAVFNRVAADLPAAFAPLRVLLFGGEASNPGAVAAVITSGPPRTLLHVYGPTECTTFATAHKVSAVDGRAATVPIGLPIANTAARVVDDRGRPVPQGVVGELWLGGDGLAIGYHNHRELTADRFVTRDGARWYRTGDRCRVNAEGAIEFVARADRQVKLRGYRIEPAEIERVLCSHPAILSAAADVVDAALERRLVACVTTRGGAAVAPDELRRYLALHLPHYAVPSAIGIVSELPLTANGKVDRTRLLRDAAAAAPMHSHVAAADPLEAELVRIWEDVLDIRPIGVTDDFFALGGHSLLAAALMDRIERLYGRRMPLSVLLQHPTIAGLASAMWEAEVARAGPITAIRASGSRPPFFFFHGDFGGGGLYCARIAHALDPEQPFYTLAPLGLHGEAPPSIEAMARHYAQLISAEVPDGPIALGGYCNGALIAFEVARLASRERDVPAVLLVHPSAVAPRLAPFDTAVRVACRVLGHDERRRVDVALRVAAAIRAWRRVSGTEAVRFAAGKLRRILLWRNSDALDTLAARAAQTDGLRDGRAPSPPAVRHDTRLWTAYMRAVGAYVPRRYSGHVVLLADPACDGTPAPRGWEHAAPRLRLVPIAGDHQACVSIHADTLGKTIDAELRAASARGQRPPSANVEVG